jgi:4-amino-4-deoxy-L-arabinose transferase-like glycosyltransferase
MKASIIGAGVVGPAVSLNPLRRSLNWLSKVSKDRKVLALLGIIALGAYLRLWNLHHLFNAIHDYDEGIYSLGARFISQGYLPYQDFILAHPPLHSLTLTSIYELFGYDFFYGKYLSVVLSLACIVLIYLVGKKMYHPTAGLFAAALFAVDTGMVFVGRRAVQETLGIFLILLAIYFAIDFINNKKPNRLLLCGLALGLTVATKYIFIPAVIAIIVALVLLTMGERFWQSLKTLGRPALWVMYLCFATMFYSLLLLLKWSLGLDVSIPFLDPMYWSVSNVAVTIFVFLLPFVISLVMLERNLPFRQWWLGLWELRHNKGLWLLLAGTVFGFILITGFFWVKMPQEFVSQTILLQQNRPGTEFPSLVGMIRLTPLVPNFLRMASLPILFVIPVIFVLLNKRDFSKGDCFLSMTLIVSLVLCQGFYHLPRYYASVFPFLLLGISQFVPPLDTKILASRLEMLTARFKVSLLVVLTILIFFLTMSLVLLTNYTGYDVFGGGRFASNEELVL